MEQCREMMRVGSLSFSLAAKLFAEDRRVSARFLYAWCRYCDDAVDSAGADHALAGRNLSELITQTRSAYAGNPQTHPVFVAFRALAQRHHLPIEYPLDLLEGMAMDVRATEYRTQADLERYCYHVAGCVGLMMVCVMGVSDRRALEHAVAAGNAMQMTNIARDIFDDARMGRVYLPAEWLTEVGVPATPEAVLDLKYRDGVTRVVRRLLDLAEANYQSGREGLKYLSIRSGFAVAAAIEVYGEIGRKVAHRGAIAWDTRTVVSTPRKLLMLLRGVSKVMLLAAGRMFRPWREVELSPYVWRPAWRSDNERNNS